MHPDAIHRIGNAARRVVARFSLITVVITVVIAVVIIVAALIKGLVVVLAVPHRPASVTTESARSAAAPGLVSRARANVQAVS
jgi:hypothetical protein